MSLGTVYANPPPTTHTHTHTHVLTHRCTKLLHCVYAHTTKHYTVRTHTYTRLHTPSHTHTHTHTHTLVDGGERAVIFDRFRGVLQTVSGEGTHFLIPWVQRPIIFSIRSKPRRVPVVTGSKGESCNHSIAGVIRGVSIFVSFSKRFCGNVLVVAVWCTPKFFISVHDRNICGTNFYTKTVNRKIYENIDPEN